MNRNFSATQIRNKSCRDCSQRIWYDIANHQWTDDSELKIRHNCSKWRPSNDEVMDGINQLSRQQIEILAEIAKLRKSVYEIGQWVQELRHQQK